MISLCLTYWVGMKARPSECFIFHEFIRLTEPGSVTLASSD